MITVTDYDRMVVIESKIPWNLDDFLETEGFEVIHAEPETIKAKVIMIVPKNAGEEETNDEFTEEFQVYLADKNYAATAEMGN